MAAKDYRTQIVSAAERQPIPEASPEDLDFDVQAAPDLDLSLEDQKLQYQIDSLKQQLKEIRETHNSRITYIGRIFWLVVWFLGCVVVCITLTGYQAASGFALSDKVLIAFITSTTVTVVGLFVVVAKWLYPSPSGNGKAPPRPRKKSAE